MRRLKVAPLAHAIRTHVEPGMHLHFSSSPSRSNASVREIARFFRDRNPRFVLSMTGFHSLAHLLPMLGLGRKYITCFLGDNYPVPRPNPLYRAIERSGATLEMWSLLSYVEALRAAALGKPFAETRSLVGTDMARDLARAGVFRPAGDPRSAPRSRFAQVGAIHPDVTFLHAPAGDRDGNLYFEAPFSEGFHGALAANVGVIATVERVINDGERGQFAFSVQVPPDRVLAVCEEPFGAHPQPLYSDPRSGVSGYVDDFEHYEVWRELSAKGAEFEAFSKRVLDAKDGGEAYRQWVGEDRLRALAIETRTIRAGRDSGHIRHAEARSGVHLTPRAPEGPPNGNEVLLTLASRAIAARVRAGRHPVILAGIGHAFLAARLAKLRLQEEGVAVNVMVETGLFDVECGPLADEFLLSYRNVALARRRTSIEDILGELTCGEGNACLAVLGAAQIDPSGALNSTRIAGQLLVGSGGANDIASCAAEVMVVTRFGPARLVPKVEYVTCLGRAVRTVVTDVACLSRDDGSMPSWRVSDIHLPPGETNAFGMIEAIRASTGWPLVTPAVPSLASPVTLEERMAIRELDPTGIHWRSERSTGQTVRGQLDKRTREA